MENIKIDNENLIDSETNNNIESECCECCELSWNDRIIGYCICSIMGLIINLCSITKIKSAISGNLLDFIIFTSIGNIISILGSLFLSGPKNQCKSMFEENRYIVSSIYLLSIFSVFIILFLPNFSGKILLLILIIIIQYISWFWYTLSYIPYARNIIKKCF